ncbi:MAG: hypothetical protein ACK5B9_00815 [Flavobacteriia bacterium]|jgi:hypothetical protein
MKAILKPITKQELRNELEVTKNTFNKWVQEICKQNDCPFQYEDIKKRHFLKRKEVQYILANI